MNGPAATRRMNGQRHLRRSKGVVPSVVVQDHRTRLLRLPSAASAIESEGAAAAVHDRARPAKTRPPRIGGDVVLAASNVTVRFGGLVANDDVSLEARRGVVTGLIGPNGAGKTTFFNVLTGAQQPTEGTVLIGGVDVTGRNRQSIAGLGMARTFQNVELFEELTVRENVAVGATRFARHGPLAALARSKRARRDERMLEQIADQAVAFVGLADIVHERVADLPYGFRRRTEIARALALGPSILLLDEPSAGMDPSETRELGELFTRVVEVLDVPVLLVEHDMTMVRQFVDYVYVLDFGSILTHGAPVDVLADHRVVDAYLGTGD